MDSHLKFARANPESCSFTPESGSISPKLRGANLESRRSPKLHGSIPESRSSTQNRATPSRNHAVPPEIRAGHPRIAQHLTQIARGQPGIAQLHRCAISKPERLVLLYLD